MTSEATTTPLDAWPPPGWVEPIETVIDAGAVRVGALLYGPEDGQPVVLLHGWADSAWSMDSIAQPLTDRHRVISLDLRGHGRSERGPYNIIHLIGDLRGVVETLDLVDPIVIGHSLGGQVSTQFGGLYPDLPRALIIVEGLGPPRHRLFDTDPDAYERAQTLQQVERVRRPVGRGSMPDLATAVGRLSRAHPMLDKTRAAFLAEKNTVTGEDGTLRWRFDPASRDWLNGHHPLTAATRWRGITCPVLVVNGSDAYERYWRYISEDPEDYPEPMTDEELSRRLANFADIRYREIADAGHMLPYDKPDELNVVIAEFLDELGRA